MVNNAEGLLKAVDVFDKSISEDYEHLETTNYQRRMWKLCILLRISCLCMEGVLIHTSKLNSVQNIQTMITAYVSCIE